MPAENTIVAINCLSIGIPRSLKIEFARRRAGFKIRDTLPERLQPDAKNLECVGQSASLTRPFGVTGRWAGTFFPAEEKHSSDTFDEERFGLLLGFAPLIISNEITYVPTT